MNDVLSVLKVWQQESGNFFSFSTEPSAILKALWNVDIKSNRYWRAKAAKQELHSQVCYGQKRERPPLVWNDPNPRKCDDDTWL